MTVRVPLLVLRGDLPGNVVPAARDTDHVVVKIYVVPVEPAQLPATEPGVERRPPTTLRSASGNAARRSAASVTEAARLLGLCPFGRRRFCVGFTATCSSSIARR